MSEGIGPFQDDVNDLIGEDFNFQLDRPHGDKPQHVDLTRRFGMGADKVEVDWDGSVIGGTTFTEGGPDIKWG